MNRAADVHLMRASLNSLRRCLLEIHRDQLSDIRFREPLCKYVIDCLLRQKYIVILLENVLVEFCDSKLVRFFVETVHLPDNF